MDTFEKKKEIIKYFLRSNSLISPDLISDFEDNQLVDDVYSSLESDPGIEYIQKLIEKNKKKEALIDGGEIGINNGKSQISKRNILEKEDSFSEEKDNLQYAQSVSDKNKNRSGFIVKKSFDLIPQKRSVEHFVSYFSSRYKQLESLLRKRKELENILSIARLKAKKDRETVAIIGLVRGKDITKNGNLIVTIEDLTGEIKVLINKNNKDLFEIANDLVEDEIVGVLGTNGDNILFSNNIIQPDIPLDKEFKKYDKDDYIVFLSDIHAGSKYFLKDDLKKFLSWLKQETGTERQREIAKKVTHVFIAGDIVDGVGIYPNQEDELELLDIYEQYEEAAELISQIPKHIPVIICPGNHDAVRLSEPQPVLSKKYAKSLYDIENVTMVSNPAVINICSDESFSGFDILMYHGYSFDYYVANVDSLRLSGGYDRADLIMKFLLKRRHLAPAYTSTLFIPEENCDALVIEDIPDFFITGHIHKTAVSNYRNVTMICGSCWQSTTSFQVKVGHHPEPSRVPVVNLKTRKVTILNFESEEENKEKDAGNDKETNPVPGDELK
ncbi:DNA-directed DNA polymerase II small subunit [Candidatus Woesearchaeota archaeon]|nr:DNA-directed DNA polymerase II small subunit [Candidatus Woesearchaeota archaeon]